MWFLNSKPSLNSSSGNNQIPYPRSWTKVPLVLIENTFITLHKFQPLWIYWPFDWVTQIEKYKRPFIFVMTKSCKTFSSIHYSYYKSNSWWFYWFISLTRKTSNLKNVNFEYVFLFDRVHSSSRKEYFHPISYNLCLNHTCLSVLLMLFQS